MGMALVRDLMQRGWNVALADINENKPFAEELGQNASFHQCNVADYDRYVCLERKFRSSRSLSFYSQAEMFQSVWDRYGRIDALCANAGIVDKRWSSRNILKMNLTVGSSIYIFDHRGSDK
jgi:NAD(P)-dependent dehydrogenase (short-subunit alcohol dehydrogenase family)